MKLSLFDYKLQKNLIAQTPAEPRDHARLLIYDRKTNHTEHDLFYNLTKYLGPNDVLVFNNTKVFKARLILNKQTGGKVEIFLLKKITRNSWLCLVKGKFQEKTILYLADFGKVCEIIKKFDSGECQVHFKLTNKKFDNFLEQYGETPLPPYIKTKDSQKINLAYQTIFAEKNGSVAAPTAGLHFTKKLISKLKKQKVGIEYITLHVGLGTFASVKTENIEDHKMHSEWAEMSTQTCKNLNQAKKQGKRIIAVGTTTVRVLENASNKAGILKPLNIEINPFFYPGYKFKFVDSMITNFHLPKSTLLMLVSAFIDQKNKQNGIKRLKTIYRMAIKNQYCFFSFGDAMWIT